MSEPVIEWREESGDDVLYVNGEVAGYVISRGVRLHNMEFPYVGCYHGAARVYAMTKEQAKWTLEALAACEGAKPVA